MNKNKKILLGVTLGLGAASYFVLRKKKIRFYDYVWCNNEECGNIEDAVAYCGAGRSVPPTQGEIETCVANANTQDDGMYNLIFAKPHNLKVGQRIFVEQDEGNTHSDYDGWTKITHIFSPYIISTNKPRLDGSTPAEGGYIYVESIFESWFDN
jgi:hypothetical protein